MRPVVVAKVILMALLVSAMAPAARADESEAAPEDAVRFGGKFELAQLLQLSEQDGWLTANFTLPADWKGQAVRAEIAGSNAMWIWRIKPAKRAESDPSIQLWYRDAGDRNNEGFTKATIYSRGGYLAISGVVRFGSRQFSITYRGRRDSKNIEVEAYVVEEGEMTQQVFDESGRSLRDIRQQHQDEIDGLLGPLLRKLAQKNLLGPGAGDVYRLFTAIRPEPAVTAHIQRLLPLLEAADGITREKASKQMAALGRAGVLAALRWDPAELSPEQRARLGQFISAHRRRAIDSVETALHDLPLLIECFQDEDLAVRQAAKAAVEAVMGQSVAYDPAQGFDQREAAALQLRRALTTGEPQPLSARK